MPSSTVDDTVGYNPLNGDPELISETVPVNTNSYIEDYEISDEGILVPSEGNGTSATGYRVYGCFNASRGCTRSAEGGSDIWLSGVGCVDAYYSLSSLLNCCGGRPSTLGGAEPEA